MNNQHNPHCGDPCEICGRESDRAYGDSLRRTHVFCGNCESLLTHELMMLGDNEPAALAYIRAKEMGKRDRKISEQRARIANLEDCLEKEKQKSMK